MKRFSIILLAVLALSSCTTMRYSARTADVQLEPIRTTAVIADVRADFTHRVTATSRRHRKESTAKKEALYRAIVEHNVDVVLDPIYKVTKRSGWYQAQVNGYPGYFENPRTELEYLHELDSIKCDNVQKFLLLQGRNE